MQQLEELKRLHKDEVDRLQEQLQRERARCSEDRAHYEKEADQVGIIFKMQILLFCTKF